MQKIEIEIHEIAVDGLPNMDELINRVAFIFDGCLISGCPLVVEKPNKYSEPVNLKRHEDYAPGSVWEGNEDVARGECIFGGITHYLVFPVSISSLKR